MQDPDEELIRRFCAGEEHAFEVLVERWSRPLLALALRLLGSHQEALEIRQMTLVKTYQKAPGFQGRARFSTWIHQVTLNLCRDRLRAKARCLGREEAALDAASLLAQHASDEPSPSVATTELERARLVAAAVLALPAREREVVVLRHYHDLPFRTIAEIVGAPETTVKSRMTRGFERLRSRLAHIAS